MSYEIAGYDCTISFNDSKFDRRTLDYVVDDYVARRAMYRDDHLGRARAAEGRGELVLAGAFSDPADGVLLIFHAPDRGVVEAFVRDDPYVLNGLVRRWKIRPWAVVIGNAPASAS